MRYMRKASAYILLFSLSILGGCKAPFAEDSNKAQKELDALLGEKPELEVAIEKLTAKGFECSDKLQPWIMQHLPKNIPSMPMPYLCTIDRTTIPFVCADHWSIFLAHDKKHVLATHISHSGPSCL